MTRTADSLPLPIAQGAARPRRRGWPRGQGVSFAAAAVLVLLAALGLLAPWLPLLDPSEINFADKLVPPGSAHWFGTDALGRDIFAQVVFGARISLAVGLSVVSVAAGIGVPMGLVAGYAGGWLDALLMRVADVFLAFPPLLLPILMVALLGPGLDHAMVAVAVSWFPWYARIARASALQLRHENYIVAARAFGASPARILAVHVLPNSLTPVIVQASLDFGYAILATASLSFIGMGASPPTPEWGLLIASSRSVFLAYWWTAAFPGLAIFVTVLAANLLGDGIKDALDPRNPGVPR
jgi:peptide/nickel transport system permease protein